MQLETIARDCLYLNWAVPVDVAPELPLPLRYELHRGGGTDWIFVSAVLFRFSGLRPASLSFPRLSYPQAHLRLYVLDGGGEPSVIFWRMMVPFWVVPVSRLFGRQPATAGWFSYPNPSADIDQESWSWKLRRGRMLEVSARPAAPGVGPGPRIGDWNRTVDYFRQRSRSYAMWEGRLRRLRRSYGDTAVVWPLAVEVRDSGLMEEMFERVDAIHWARPHSAWLCPEIPLSFEVGKAIRLPLPRPRARVASVADGA